MSELTILRRASDGLTYALRLTEPRCRSIHVELASRYAQFAAALRLAAQRLD